MVPGELGAPVLAGDRGAERPSQKAICAASSACAPITPRQVPTTQSMPDSRQVGTAAKGPLMREGEETAMAARRPFSSSGTALVAVITATSARPSTTCATA